MQDKAFDQLFKDRFEGAEVQPSAAVWDKIRKDLHPERKKKSPVYWVAAAAILLTLSASLLFKRTEKIPLQGKAVLVKQSPPQDHTRQLSIPADRPALSGAELNAKQDTEVPAQATKATPKTHSEAHLIAGLEKAVQPDFNDVAAATHPEANQSLSETNLATQHNTTPEVEHTLVATLARKDTVIDEENGTMPYDADQPVVGGRTRIRNAGDLVNFVIDKIDKREQKIVEFNTDNDDNSSLVAINIGPFRFNSKKHK